MSGNQTDLDEVVDRLFEFETGDTITLVTDAGSITGNVTDVRRCADGARVTVADRESDRLVRVTTEWYGGWLDPLVDASPADPDSDADSAFGADSVRPVGTLVDVRIVAAAADQRKPRNRP